MRINSKGQITIPKKLRDTLGWLPHTHIEVKCVGEELRIKKAKQVVFSKKIIADVASKSPVSMSTDEIMNLTRG